MVKYGDTICILLTTESGENKRIGEIFYEERVTLHQQEHITWAQFNQNMEDFKTGATDAIRDLLRDAENYEKVKHIPFKDMIAVLERNGYKVERR